MREHTEGVRFCPHCGCELHRLAESFALLPGTLLNDRFLIKTTIGVGGNGIIYQAWDNKLHTTVAIKECFPSGYL